MNHTKSRETKSTENQSKVQFQLELSLAQLIPSLSLPVISFMKNVFGQKCKTSLVWGATLEETS